MLGGCESKSAPPPAAKPAPAVAPPAEAAPAASEPAATAPPPTAAGGVGQIQGVVKWVDQPRTRKPMNVAADPNCARMYATAPLLDELLTINPNGTLLDVFVYLKDGLPEGRTWDPPDQALLLDQKGCRYEPHVFGIMVGQTLTIRNSDGTAHNINCNPKANAGFNRGQPQMGMQFDQVFTVNEIMVPFKCDVHPWMKAFGAVMTHPFFDTTDNTGVFKISNVPAGTYQLSTWLEHPGLPPQTLTITVSPDETTDVSFSYQRH